MRKYIGLAALSSIMLAVPALAQHVGISSGTKYADTLTRPDASSGTFGVGITPAVSTGTPGVSTGTPHGDGVHNRDTNPAASNPDLPLPGTANPNNRAAPMVPSPMPVPAPRANVPGPGGAQGSPAQNGGGLRIEEAP